VTDADRLQAGSQVRFLAVGEKWESYSLIVCRHVNQAVLLHMPEEIISEKKYILQRAF